MPNNNLENILSSSAIPDDISKEILKSILGVINYTPKIGIMGKSGAGKSTLINSLVGKEICKTGSVGGCTRDTQEIMVPCGSRKLCFIDFPGVAENMDRNREYANLYSENIKNLDIILWVIKVDDRANKDDEEFYNWLIQYYKKERILFVLSQCDKADPSRDFNYSLYRPGDKQKVIIEQNQQRIMNSFHVSSNMVIPVACSFYDNKFDRYNIDLLLLRIIKTVPKEARSSLLSSVDKDNVSSAAKEDAQSSFKSVVEDIINTVIDYAPIPQVAKGPLKKVVSYVTEKIEGLWDSIFG